MTQSALGQGLLGHSRAVILHNQQPSGAYLACPTMPDYRFSWFRDGAFIAYALTLDGDAGQIGYAGSMAAQWESAQAFHDWCASTINRRADAIERTITRAYNNDPLEPADLLNTRYKPDGTAGPDDWPEFQLDGLGTWLWSLAELVPRMRLEPLPVPWENAVRLVARYLAALWQVPCYDCWEERGDDLHVSTLAAIYAGLQAAEGLVPVLDFRAERAALRAFVLEQGLTPTGELAKSIGIDMVDANLLGVAVPHGLLAPDDPIMVRTVARIERELHPPGSGIHRHLDDVYYGGGAWVLLALWLAWYYVAAGEPEKARALLRWSAEQADADGNLPEQVVPPMLAPHHYAPWVAQRGPIANPLLWTHAMYLIVHHLLAGVPHTRAQPVRDTAVSHRRSE